MIVVDPRMMYPSLQLYTMVSLNVVLAGVVGDPLVMEGGGPQSTAVINHRNKS